VIYISIWLLIITLFSSPLERPSPLYVGARAAAMGNAFVALADDPTALFWNPAGIIQTAGTSLFGQMKLDRSDFRFDPKGITFRWRRFGLGWGNKIAVGLEGTPDYNYYSGALKLSQRISIGISLKFKRRHPCGYYQFFGYKRSSDVGILAYPMDRLSVGFVLREGEGEWDEFALGGAYRGSRAILTLDLIAVEHKPAIHLGLEFIPISHLRLRGGLWEKGTDEEGGLSVGVGLYIRGVSLHYAWIRISGEDAHYLGVHLTTISISKRSAISFQGHSASPSFKMTINDNK
jgi:hypothetical protein